MEQFIDKESIKSYFDLGCGNGLITARIGNYFNLKCENIFGGDVFNCHNQQLTYVSIDPNQSLIDLCKYVFFYNFQFASFFRFLASQSVNLITCLVTLHHISNIENILQELARIIKPNGYLIIREHDCKLERSILTKYLNFIHAIMIIARIGEFSNEYLKDENHFLSWSEQKQKIIKYTKSIQYKTRDEWQKKLESVGFHLLAIFDYDLNKTTNPQQLFYALYKRTEKIN